MHDWMLKLLTFLPSWGVVFLLGLFMPRLVREDILFGVRIPQDRLKSPSAAGLRGLYTRCYLAFSIPVSVFMAWHIFDTENIFWFSLGFFFLLLGQGVLYIWIHKKARRLKESEKWLEGKIQSTVVETSFRKNAGPVSGWWYLIPLVIVFANMAFSIWNYASLGSMLPVHFNAAGEADRWVDKSFLNVFLLCLTQIVLTAMMFFVHWMIGASKQELNPADPEASVARVIRFRRTWSVYLLFLNIFLLLLTSYFHWKALGFIRTSSSLSIGLTTAWMVLLFGSLLYLVFALGQGGSRLRIGSGADTGRVNRDDDRFWKWGMFYYNPDDPAMFVEKRFGIGWTNNFANPKANLMLVFLILAIVALTLIVPK